MEDGEDESRVDDIPVNFKRPRRRSIHEDETLDAQGN
jgi:hypothetical protein